MPAHFPTAAAAVSSHEEAVLAALCIASCLSGVPDSEETENGEPGALCAARRLHRVVSRWEPSTLYGYASPRDWTV